MTGQGLIGNNMFAYCMNSPTCYCDPNGYACKYADIINRCLSGGVYANSGGNATGVSSSTVVGGGGSPFPVAGFSFSEALDFIDLLAETNDLLNGFGNLSRAGEFGIKSYSDLKKEIAGTGLQAHHIIEQRFLEALGIDVSSALSVVVTRQEHQVFTNAWRNAFGYGKTVYTSLSRDQIWAVVQEIYKDYSNLLSAAWDTLF